MRPPNSRERQIMQHLRGAGWVNATGLPDSPRTLAKLVKKAGSNVSERRAVRRIASRTWDFRRRKRRF
jgi:hypothetical protein